MALGGMSDDPLIARADAAIDAARDLRNDRCELVRAHDTLRHSLRLATLQTAMDRAERRARQEDGRFSSSIRTPRPPA